MFERVGWLRLLLLAALGWAANVTGAWQVVLWTSGGVVTGKASLEQTGEAVTGWVGPSENDPIPIKGFLKGNKLTIKTYPQPGRTVAFDQCDLNLSNDKMTGSMNSGKGKIEFVKSIRPRSGRNGAVGRSSAVVVTGAWHAHFG